MHYRLFLPVKHKCQSLKLKVHVTALICKSVVTLLGSVSVKYEVLVIGLANGFHFPEIVEKKIFKIGFYYTILYLWDFEYLHCMLSFSSEISLDITSMVLVIKVKCQPCQF